MSADSKGELLGRFAPRKGSKVEYFHRLLERGFFDEPRTSKEVAERLRENWGWNVLPKNVSTYLARIQQQEVMRSIEVKNTRYWYAAWVERSSALAMTQQSATEKNAAASLFSESLTSKMDGFEQDIKDLHWVYGASGTCTAFMLRKILEKLLVVVFSRHGKAAVLKDADGRGIGLERMLDAATREQIGGLPILTGATARAVRGVKFLGDQSAHNPLTSTRMETIVPQLPFIITAYEELASHL